MAGGAFDRLFRSQTAGILFLAAALFCAPLLMGSPAVFDDTAYYYSQGEYFVGNVGGHEAKLDVARVRDPTSLVTSETTGDHGQNLSIMGARSPTYGVFIYLAEKIGSVWLVAAIQCLISAWLLLLWVRLSVGTITWTQKSALVILLAVGTGLPFFSSFIMPDIFAALAIICVALIYVYDRRLSQPERLGVWALLVCCVAFHTATGAVVLATAGASASLLMIRNRGRLAVARRTGAVIVAVFLGMIQNSALQTLYRWQTNETQSTPPFLMARVLADGPGQQYLDKHCPGGAAPTLCRFAGKHVRSETDFLWSQNRRAGVLALESATLRQSLKREEFGFVIASIKEAPAGEIVAAARNWTHQLLNFYVFEPLIAPSYYSRSGFWSRTSLGTMVSASEATRIYPNQPLRLSPQPLFWWHLFVMLGIVAIAAKGAIDVGRRSTMVFQQHEVEDLQLSAALIAIGVIMNAGVCGILAGSFARYEARVIWLLPAAAAIMVLGIGRLSLRRPGDREPEERTTASGAPTPVRDVRVA